MSRSFNLIFEKGEKYIIGYCPEVPGANGQSITREECKQSLIEAIELILETQSEHNIVKNK